MKLYRTAKGVFLEQGDKFYVLNDDWDVLINKDSLHSYLNTVVIGLEAVAADDADNWLSEGSLLAPISSQEVWAAGVTYLKSRDARMEESDTAASLYDMVYDAERPELFFKAIAQRVSANGQPVNIRKDSAWNVPEPELTLFINSTGNIQGYTIGNDMSSRSIEGENALYLPQAKIYEKSAALGPCLYLTHEPFPRDAVISMDIIRNEQLVYHDHTTVSRIKRSFEELTEHLFRECDFPHGCFLMTGTCMVPPSTFTLQVGDVVEISIDHIGKLTNTIAVNPKNLKLM